ncbi:MAG TPA: hypothetical protein PK264_13750 [Hyphomicrobiaceae bacterium]|nr:hypothetical protein [Hyphomicrobiaceae bacterium]
MKQQMIDMMAMMMPYMRPLAQAAGAAALFAIAARLIGQTSIARLLAALVLVIGVFFIACEVAGRFLGFEPTILFAAPADRALYRNQWPFWCIGLTGLVIGLLIRAGTSSKSA